MLQIYPYNTRHPLSLQLFSQLLGLPSSLLPILLPLFIDCLTDIPLDMRVKGLIPQLPQAQEEEIGDERVEEHTSYGGCIREGLKYVATDVRQGCVDLLHLLQTVGFQKEYEGEYHKETGSGIEMSSAIMMVVSSILPPVKSTLHYLAFWENGDSPVLTVALFVASLASSWANLSSSPFWQCSQATSTS